MNNEITGTFVSTDWSAKLSSFDTDHLPELNDKYSEISTDIIDSLHANMSKLEELTGQLGFVLSEIKTVMKI